MNCTENRRTFSWRWRSDNEKLVQDMMSPGDNLPKCVKLFFKMIQKCYKNKSIIPIIHAMCYSTDDTTDYIYEGYGNNRKGTFRLVSNKSLKNAGSRSRYTIDNSKKKIDMISYLFELGYDLCLSPPDCVSNNLGFESILGVW